MLGSILLLVFLLLLCWLLFVWFDLNGLNRSSFVVIRSGICTIIS